jgi:hypothetical protein
MSDDKFNFSLAYNDDLTEIAVIFESDKTISSEEYIKRLEAWLEFCRLSLHEMLKNRPQLESDPDLN